MSRRRNPPSSVRDEMELERRKDTNAMLFVALMIWVSWTVGCVLLAMILSQEAAHVSR